MLTKQSLALKVLLYLVAVGFALAAFKRQKRSADGGGWAAYVQAARSCLSAIRRRGRDAPALAWVAFGWLTVAGINATLAVLRIVDLDHIVRWLLVDENATFYEERRTTQLLLVLIGVGVLLAVLAIVALVARRVPLLAAALATSSALAVYVVVRSISYHHVDRVIGQRVLGVYVNSWLELAGVLVIVAAAGKTLRHTSTPRST